jgi:dipeptidyl aminopeptidase/acylaminoacyl peptidase
MSAVDAVLTRSYADGDRLGITGGSYGAYLTAFALGQTDRFKAAVTVRLCFDLETEHLTGEEDSAIYRHNWGEKTAESWTLLVAQSPLTYAHRITTPTLLLHGEVDHSTPLHQSEELFHILIANGCEAELVCYPEGSHPFMTSGYPAHRVDALERMLGWFRRHLGGPRPGANGREPG